jgi:anti-sigma B factor antagonist
VPVASFYSFDYISGHMKIKNHILDQFAVISVSGKIDDYDSELLQESIMSVIEQGNKKILIDMNSVETITSHTLGSLIHIWKKIGEINGEIFIISGQSYLSEIFDLYNLKTIFTIFTTADAFKQTIIKKADESAEAKVQERNKYKIITLTNPAQTMIWPGSLDTVINKVAAEGNIYIAMNMDNIEHVYSGSLGVFMKWHKALWEKKGCLCFFRLRSVVFAFFKQSGLDRIFIIYGTEQELR